MQNFGYFLGVVDDGLGSDFLATPVIPEFYESD